MDPKTLNEKVKKLDFNLINKDERNVNMNTGNKTEKDLFLENLITKDYEKYIEFLSQEDYFQDKMVNLQNRYFFIPRRLKNKDNTLDIINKNTKEKDTFYNKLLHQFNEGINSNTHVIHNAGSASKPHSLNSSYRQDNRSKMKK